MDNQSLKLPKGVQYSNMNAFKIEEKRYRYYKGHKTDFSQLLDLNTLSQDQLKEKQIVKYELEHKDVFRFDQPQGLFVVKGFLDYEAQISLAKSCINDLIQKPYRTNLFIYEEEKVIKKVCKGDKSLVNDYDKYYFDKKIRWTNLGYQYDWTNRKYPEDRTVVPQQIQDLSSQANSLLQLQDKYKSESIIINFYSTTDYMTGHLDDAEIDQVSPIFSFSIGQSCVFLIGGPDKNTIPLAIRLDSGDVCVMSGASRLCYHGVPRVIDKSFQQENTFKNESSQKEKKSPENNNSLDLNSNKYNDTFTNNDLHVFNYLSENRININIRQVYEPDIGNQK